MAELTLYPSLRGAKLVSTSTDATVTTYGRTENVAQNVSVGSYVALTGYGLNLGGGYYYLQTNDKDFYASVQVSDGTVSGGWKLGSWGRTYTDSQAQSMIDALIENNQRIFANNLLCARFSYKFTTAEKQQILKLQDNLEKRNEDLKNSGLLTDVSTGVPSGYQELESYLENLKQSGVGSVTVATWVAVVAVCTVIAGLATAAYFCYRQAYAESETDVKYSDELTATLKSKLTDEEYEQLETETNQQLTKAVLKAKWNSMGTSTKAILIVAVVLLAIPELRTIFGDVKGGHGR